MKILLLAYACEPNAGSEYGVGWNMATHLAKENDVYVVTRSRCKDKIEKELKENPVKNLHFIFYDIPSFIYYKKEIGSHWGEQYNYILWQLFVKKTVRKHIKTKQIDIIHHITFNQYRTPSPGYFLNTPFVIGPIGGAEIIADCFMQELDPHTLRKENIRKKGKDLKIFSWLCKKSNNKKYILCSSYENMERLSPFKGNASISVLPAIGFNPNDFEEIQPISKESSSFEMVYAGKLYDWKGVHVFLCAVKKGLLDNACTNFKIKLVGLRFQNEQEKVKLWIKENGLEQYTEIIPFMDRSELLKLLATCSLSVYPAFRDSGSMSILEASVLGCPTICFDAGGQDAFPDDVLIKIPVKSNFEETLSMFSEKLFWAYHHPNLISEIGIKSKKYVYENLTWKKKTEIINSIYKNLVH